MKLYYDFSEGEWYQTSGNPLYFGKDADQLARRHKTKGSGFSFQALAQEKVIPLIGIMTSRSRGPGKLAGNLPFLKNLHLYLTKQGICSCLITAEDILQENWRGYVNTDGQNKWMLVQIPPPSLIYNRIPFRKFEESSRYTRLKLLLRELQIPMFNPGFIDKFDLYGWLKQDPFLEDALPDTIRPSSAKELAGFIEKYRRVYIKPGKGSKGTGLSFLELDDDGGLTARAPQSLCRYSDFADYWSKQETRIRSLNAIAQQAITPKKLNGHRYDFRILAHYASPSYKVTGKAVRMSEKQEVTTHIPKGGRLYPYQKLRTRELDEQFDRIVKHCGEAAAAHYGFLGEFSIDLGQDETGKLFLYEINAKPMQFDEEEIERSRLESLKKLFLEMASK